MFTRLEEILSKLCTKFEKLDVIIEIQLVLVLIEQSGFHTTLKRLSDPLLISNQLKSKSAPDPPTAVGFLTALPASPRIVAGRGLKRKLFYVSKNLSVCT